MQKKFSRSKLIIFPKFQYTIIGANLFIIIMTGLVFSFGAYRSFSKMKNMGLSAGLSEQHSFYKFLTFQYENLTSYMIVSLIIAIILSTVITVLISHKFAGPLFRLKKYLQNAAETGETDKLTFRKGDYLVDLADDFNKVIEKVRNRKDD
tara:strand:+ start:445 stop:894 length:450 start_codon:yes stop_codon:yes gene_type:complete